MSGHSPFVSNHPYSVAATMTNGPIWLSGSRDLNAHPFLPAVF